MKVGVLTAPVSRQPLDKFIPFAASIGVQQLELVEHCRVLAYHDDWCECRPPGHVQAVFPRHDSSRSQAWG
jgi:hypothetical protein